MTKATATFIKQCDSFIGNAQLYELSEPIEYDKPRGKDDPPSKTTIFVIVSAVNAMFSGPETYIFPANENGEVLDWDELEGSYCGGYSHEKALEDAGFSVEKRTEA